MNELFKKSIKFYYNFPSGWLHEAWGNMSVVPTRNYTKDAQMAIVSLEVTVAFLFQSDDERYIVRHWRDIFWSQVPQNLDKHWRQMFNANISHFQERLMMTEGAGTRHGCQGMMLWELLYKEKREIDIHASESVRASCQASEQSHTESLEGTE